MASRHASNYSFLADINEVQMAAPGDWKLTVQTSQQMNIKAITTMALLASFGYSAVVQSDSAPMKKGIAPPPPRKGPLPTAKPTNVLLPKGKTLGGAIPVKQNASIESGGLNLSQDVLAQGLAGLRKTQSAGSVGATKSPAFDSTGVTKAASQPVPAKPQTGGFFASQEALVQGRAGLRKTGGQFPVESHSKPASQTPKPIVETKPVTQVAPKVGWTQPKVAEKQAVSHPNPTGIMGKVPEQIPSVKKPEHSKKSPSLADILPDIVKEEGKDPMTHGPITVIHHHYHHMDKNAPVA